jgi:hypothetical protein
VVASKKLSEDAVDVDDECTPDAAEDMEGESGVEGRDLHLFEGSGQKEMMAGASGVDERDIDAERLADGDIDLESEKALLEVQRLARVVGEREAARGGRCHHADHRLDVLVENLLHCGWLRELDAFFQGVRAAGVEHNQVRGPLEGGAERHGMWICEAVVRS